MSFRVPSFRGGWPNPRASYRKRQKDEIQKYKVTRTDGTDVGNNSYLVVNTDEPYAGEVADLIEQHERGKGTWEHGVGSMRKIMGIQEEAFDFPEDLPEWHVTYEDDEGDVERTRFPSVSRAEDFMRSLPPASNPQIERIP